MLVPSTPEGAASSSSRRERSRVRSTPCRSPRSCSSSCSWWPARPLFQIARCLRDEDLRADRQYEFMQLDAEMSFVTQDDVLDAHQRSRARRGRSGDGRAAAAIERITWHEAMERFGVDKPDLRFGLELVELTDVFVGDRVQSVRRRGAIKAIRVPARREYGRNQLDELPTGRRHSARGPGVARSAPTPFDSPVAKFLSDDESAALRGRRRARATCCSRRRRLGDDLRGARAAAQRPLGRRSTRARSATCGSSTSRCSSAGTQQGHPSRPPPVHLPIPTTSAARHRPDGRACRRPTTWCSRLELGSGSIRIHETPTAAGVLRGARDHRGRADRNSGSSSTRSSTARRRTAGSRSASIASRRSSPARRTSARSSVPQDAVGRRPDDQLAAPVDPAQLAQLGIHVSVPKG